MLETHDRGIRSAEEVAAFESKRVTVKAARIEDRCLGWGNGAAATIVGPCVREIAAFALAD